MTTSWHCWKQVWRAILMIKSEWLDLQRKNKSHTLPILTFPFAKELNMTVKELVSDENKQAELICYIANKYPTNAAIGLMDLSVEAESFGANVRFFDMDIPTVIGSLVETIEDADALKVPNPLHGRTGTYVKAIHLVKEANLNKPVLPGVIGPFSLAGRLMDMTEIMVNCYLEPEFVEIVLNKTTEFIISYIKAFKEAGADGIIMAEPAAGVLSPALCENFSTKYVNQIIEAISDDNFIFVYHNCGDVISLMETIKNVNADVFHFGDSIDIKVMLKEMPRDKLIMGNISPVKIIKDGTPDTVREKTLALLCECNQDENFIISTGCDVPPTAPIENIEAYFKAVQDYKKEHKKGNQIIPNEKLKMKPGDEFAF